MKLLKLGRQILLREQLAIAICVRRGSLVTGYLKENPPVLCIEEIRGSARQEREAVLIPLSTSIDEILKFDSGERYYSGDQDVFAGVIESTDEEINALREAGYRVRDLRNVRLVDFLKDLEYGFRHDGAGPSGAGEQRGGPSAGRNERMIR
jgi:hypothetical protein